MQIRIQRGHFSADPCRSGSGTLFFLCRETAVYLDDWLGLKSLDERGGLHLLNHPGDHNHLLPNWLSENIIRPFLLTPPA